MSGAPGLTEKEIFSFLTSGDEPILDKFYFDDAAIVPTNGSGALIITSDFVRGPHFDLAEAGYLSFFDLAHYLVAANVSDIAAMGVVPLGILDIFRYPKSTPAQVKKDFLAGLADAAQRFDVRIVGGDSGSYVSFVLGATCFGFAGKGRVLQRNAACEGQVLCLAGSAGRCRAAQKAHLETGKTSVSPDVANRLLDSWRRPNPPVKFGAWLGENKLAFAAQDTSDGLGSAISDICEQSGVRINLKDIVHVVDRDVQHVADCFDVPALDLALSVSPDFGLLFSTNREDLRAIRANPFGQDICVLGTFTAGEGAYLDDGQNERRRLPLEVYDHLGDLRP